MDIRIILEYATPILTLVIGSFIFYDAKKRKAIAEARKAEAENIMRVNGKNCMRRRRRRMMN